MHVTSGLTIAESTYIIVIRPVAEEATRAGISGHRRWSATPLDRWAYEALRNIKNCMKTVLQRLNGLVSRTKHSDSIGYPREMYDLSGVC